jgi:hypothetical protein
MIGFTAFAEDSNNKEVEYQRTSNCHVIVVDLKVYPRHEVFIYFLFSFGDFFLALQSWYHNYDDSSQSKFTKFVAI